MYSFQKDIIKKIKLGESSVAGVPGELLEGDRAAGSPESAVLWTDQDGNSINLMEISKKRDVTKFARDVFRTLVPDEADWLKVMISPQPNKQCDDGLARMDLPQDKKDAFKSMV